MTGDFFPEPEFKIPESWKPKGGVEPDYSFAADKPCKGIYGITKKLAECSCCHAKIMGAAPRVCAACMIVCSFSDQQCQLNTREILEECRDCGMGIRYGQLVYRIKNLVAICDGCAKPYIPDGFWTLMEPDEDSTTVSD